MPKMPSGKYSAIDMIICVILCPIMKMAYCRYFFVPSFSASVIMKMICVAARMPKIQSYNDRIKATIRADMKASEVAWKWIVCSFFAKKVMIMASKPMRPNAKKMFAIAI